MDVEFSVKTEGYMSADERQSLRHWLRQNFGGTIDELIWAEVDWHVLVVKEGECIAHVDLLIRAIRVEAKPLTIGGVGGVATQPEWRRRGLAVR